MEGHYTIGGNSMQESSIYTHFFEGGLWHLVQSNGIMPSYILLLYAIPSFHYANPWVYIVLYQRGWVSSRHTMGGGMAANLPLKPVKGPDCQQQGVSNLPGQTKGLIQPWERWHMDRQTHRQERIYDLGRQGMIATGTIAFRQGLMNFIRPFAYQNATWCSVHFTLSKQN